MTRLQRLPSRCSARRFVGGGLLLLWTFVSLGIPLPTPVQKDLSRPFPCMHRGCGCQSADQCWANCCCFSPAERVAWAKQNGVAIPAETLAAADADAHQPAAGCKSCCSKHAPPARVKSCCARSSCNTNAHKHCEGSSTKNPPSGDLLLFVQALKCQGVTMQLLGPIVSVVPVDPTADLGADVPSGWISLTDELSPSRSVQPPAPPPRACC